MTENYSRSERRVLSFPAVHPCENISPATFLSSLICISHNICNYQSKFFATQRRNAREIIRQIHILLLFLEEIREHGLELADSVVICFFELHVSFQKIQFLMEDCTRDGAKLWMLMNCEFVAAQFRHMIRAVATALDVLPMDRIEVCGEVKELVDLVAKQARKVEFELERNDEGTMKRVHAVLYQFEKGVEPAYIALKQILDYLEIKSWNDCNKEIKFLEEEIRFQYSDCSEREVPLLSSLVGFLSYCRAVVFETLNFRNVSEESDVRCNTEMLSCLNPEDFRCPISLELMTDPVTVSTGQTYDRSSIQKWLKAGNLICPKTGEKLTSKELVPNKAVKKLIQQFCADNGISLAKSGSQTRDITRTVTPASQASAEAIRLVSMFLARRLVFGSNEQKNKAAYEVRLLAKSNIFNRSCLVEAGTVLPLINLASSRDTCTQENAIGSLLKLSKHNGGRREIMDNCGLMPILMVLKKGTSLEARQMAAATVFYLSSVKEYRKLIGETPEVIPGLIELIKEGTTCGKKNAVVAIFGLLFSPQNHRKVLAAGTVPLLVSMLNSSDTAEITMDSLAVLASLAESGEGTSAILEASALPLITSILQGTGSRAGKEYCVSILLSVCVIGGVEVLSILAKDPSLMSSLYSVLDDGTAHAKKKARSLIKLLLEFNEKRQSTLMFQNEPSSLRVL